MRLDQKIAIGVVALLLLAGLTTINAVPFYRIGGPGFSDLFGLDLINVFLFHRCPEAVGNFYAVSGEICGDPEGRPMLYPPVLFYLFGWTAWLDFPATLYVWTAFSILAYVFGGVFLFKCLRPQHSHAVVVFSAFWLFMSLQFPMVFSLERASNDSFIFVAALLALWCLHEQRWGGTGFLLVLLTAYKMYPVFVVLGVALHLLGRPGLRPFVVATVGSALVLFVMFFQQHWVYLSEVLPGWASKQAPYTVGLDHVILNMNHWASGAGTLMCLGLLGMMFWVARQPSHGSETFLYAFAICTFFQKTAFDYSLITMYPLVAWLFLRALGESPPRERFQALGLVVTWLLIFVIFRHFGDFYAGFAKYGLMWGWLVMGALYLVRTHPKAHGDMAKAPQEA